MIFDGYDFSQYWRCRLLDVPMAARDVVEKDIPGRAGTKFVRADLSPKDLVVEMRLKLPEGMHDPTTVQYIKNLALRHLSATTERELRFYEQPDVVYKAVCTEVTEFSNPTYTGATTATFHLCDPLKYYSMRRVYHVSEGENEVKVGGSWEVLPVFDLVTGAVARVKVDIGGSFVECVGPFSAGDKLVIDYEKGNAYRNGANCQFTLDSTFAVLEAGVQQFSVTGASGTVGFIERSV